MMLKTHVCLTILFLEVDIQDEASKLEIVPLVLICYPTHPQGTITRGLLQQPFHA